MKPYFKTGFWECGFSPIKRFPKYQGLKAGDEYYDIAISSYSPKFGYGNQLQGNSQQKTFIVDSPNINPDIKSEFEKPFFAVPIQRKKPDHPSMEKLLLKTLQRRGRFVQWDAPKEPRIDSPHKGSVYKLPPHLNSKISNVGFLKKIMLSRQLLLPTPKAPSSPQVYLDKKLEGKMTTEAALYYDSSIKVFVGESMDNEMQLIGKEGKFSHFLRSLY